VRQLAGQRAQAIERGGVVAELPGRPQAPLDRRPVAIGQVVKDVAFLVTLMPRVRQFDAYLGRS
jgi:hypothetical protein